MTDGGTVPGEDPRDDEYDVLVRVVAGGVAVLAGVSALGVMAWTIDDIVTVGSGTLGAVAVGIALRLVALSFAGMALPGALAGVLLARLRVLSRPLRQRALIVVGLGVMIALVRTGAVGLGLGGVVPREYAVLETALGAVEASAVLAAALYYVGTRRRIRVEERLRLQEALHAERARAELEREELRVRRDVAHRLHGGLQQRMVLINREIEEIRDELLRHGDHQDAQSLTALSQTLDEVRESEVRAVAHELYPLAAEIDLPSALLVIADRLPASVRMHVTYDGSAEKVYAGLSLSAPERVLLYSVVEESATNAVRHGRARNVWVTLGIAHGTDRRATAHVVVDDDGTGLPSGTLPSLSGLAVLQARARARGGDLTMAPGPRGGVRIATRLPLERAGGSVADGDAARGPGDTGRARW